MTNHILKEDVEFLAHYGVKGMKWGVRRYETPSKLKIAPTDSGVTKRVKRDYNSMSDREFMGKYAASKKRYSKRVAKYGDPYMKSPLAQRGKKLESGDTRGKNPNYNEQQRKRDRQVYGKGGERRVNKRLNDGDKISNARGEEVTRRNKVMNRNKYARKGGKVVGAVGGAAAGYFGTRAFVNLMGRSAVTRRVVSTMLGNNPALGQAFAMAITSTTGQATIAAGAGWLGQYLGGDAAVNINMRTAGYDPNRK